MNDHPTQIDLLEQEMLDRLLTAQLAMTSVIQQAQEKMAERFCRLIAQLRNAQAPPSEARSADLPHASSPVPLPG